MYYIITGKTDFAIHRNMHAKMLSIITKNQTDFVCSLFNQPERFINTTTSFIAQCLEFLGVRPVF